LKSLPKIELTLIQSLPISKDSSNNTQRPRKMRDSYKSVKKLLLIGILLRLRLELIKIENPSWLHEKYDLINDMFNDIQ